MSEDTVLEEVRLAVVGKPASGKTVFLTMLAYEMREKHRKFAVKYGNDHSQQYIEERIKQIIDDGVWPRATGADIEEHIEIRILHHDGGHSYSIFSTDLPGEAHERIFGADPDGWVLEVEVLKKYGKYRKFVERILRYIDSSTCFLLLCDPVTIGPNDEVNEKKNKRLAKIQRNNQDVMFLKILEAIHKNKENYPPVFIAFTHWDLMENEVDNFESFVENSLPSTMAYLKRTWNPSNYAVGFCSNVGGVDKKKVSDKPLRFEYRPHLPVAPYGLAESFFWFVKRIIGRDELEEVYDEDDY